MAWARLITYPGGTEEQYRAVVDEVGDAHANAPGRLFLTAGPVRARLADLHGVGDEGGVLRMGAGARRAGARPSG